MANTLTQVANLVDEVADLLRHDNVDARILTWVNITLQDIMARAQTTLWYKIARVDFTANLGQVDFSATSTRVANPICLVVVLAAGTTYVPRYLTQVDFSRLAHQQDGAALDFGSFPTHWSIGPSDTTAGGATIPETGTKQTLFLYPRNTAALAAYLFYTGPRSTTPLSGTGYLELPYHFEHVVVWGAATMGARVLRPNLYPAFKAEYEQALDAMNTIMSYNPDSVPVLRSIRGPYLGNQYDYNLPTTITG